MDFLTFLRKNLPSFSDPATSLCARMILRFEDVPPSSDPRELAPFLYRRLNHQATKGFQTLMMVYRRMEPSTELPEDLKRDERTMMEAINQIVRLQNGDPEHRDF